jgi:hypothetical protein
MSSTQRSEYQKAAIAELAKRNLVRRAMRSSLHGEQRKVWDSKSRRIAVLAGRRSGKTSMMVRLIARELLACGKDEFVGFSAITRKLAKDLIWEPLKRLNEEHSMGFTFLENEGKITTPGGGFFRVLGFDALPEIEKCRGYKTRAFFMDEVSTVADKVQEIVKSAIGPSLIDLSGLLLIAGTPGPTPDGYWWQASTGQPGFEHWERFHWTFKENTALHAAKGCSAADIEAEILKENAFSVHDTAYRREYLAEWVAEVSMLVFQDFSTSHNVVQMPKARMKGWRYAIGIDFGVVDSTAWVVAAWPDTPGGGGQLMVIVAELKRAGLRADEVSSNTKNLVEHYRPAIVIGDSAGRVWIDDYNDRYAKQTGRWIEKANKLDVVGQVDSINLQLRSRTLKVATHCQQLITELGKVVWATEERKKVKTRQEDHLLDAMRYLVMGTASVRSTDSNTEADDLAEEQEARFKAARAELEAQRDAELEDHWA